MNDGGLLYGVQHGWRTRTWLGPNMQCIHDSHFSRVGGLYVMCKRSGLDLTGELVLSWILITADC
jgi:hypothetical protein